MEVNIKKYASPASVFWEGKKYMKQNLTTFLVMEKNLDKNFYTSPTWDIVTLRTLLLRFGHGGIGGKKLGLKKFYNFYTSRLLVLDRLMPPTTDLVHLGII